MDDRTPPRGARGRVPVGGSLSLDDDDLEPLDAESTRVGGGPGGDEADFDESSGGAADGVATRMVPDAAIVGELRASVPSAEGRDQKVISLHSTPDSVVVGRGSAADWQIDDESLSRRHAQFHWTGRALEVEDLGSANGTRVNGRPIRSATPVQPGDSVQLGTVTITLSLRGATGMGASMADEKVTRYTAIPAAPTVVGGAHSPSSGSHLTPPPSAFLTGPSQIVSGTVRPPGQPAPNPQVFRPDSSWLPPHEETRPWDPAAALLPLLEPTVDWRELILRHRKLVLVGLATLVLGGGIFTYAQVVERAERERLEEEALRVSASARRAAAQAATDPVVTQLVGDGGVVTSSPDAGEPSDRGAPDGGAGAVLPPLQGNAALAQAIALYDQGRLADSLIYWKQLVKESDDESAHFMVRLIEARLKKRGTEP
jgi:hypothetical protein